MAVLIVHLLEVIQIQDREAEVQTIFIPIFTSFQKALIKGGPVSESGQAIDSRLLAYSVQIGLSAQPRHDPGEQLSSAYWLFDVVDSPRIESLGKLILFLATGKEDNRDFPGLWKILKFATKRYSILIGHSYVQKNQRRGFLNGQ